MFNHITAAKQTESDVAATVAGVTTQEAAVATVAVRGDVKDTGRVRFGAGMMRF